MMKWDKQGMETLNDAITQALELTGYALQDDIREAQVIPRKTGLLQGEAFDVDISHSGEGFVRLSFNTPYARRLYFHPEYHFNQEFNSNAQGMWMTLWMEGGIYQNRATEIFSKLLKI